MEGMTLLGEYVPSSQQWVRDQVAAYEASGGAEANTLRATGDPIVVITSVGATSGKLRKNPVMRVEKDGKYVAIASKGGAPEDPAWADNFRAHPEVDLQDGPEPRSYRARELSGEERREWWEHAVATWPTYASYQEKTDREIPVFLLEPVE
ncbi:nitroreductase family deazaflavin-dependent oxidoreductase [Nocardioides maradonensis]